MTEETISAFESSLRLYSGTALVSNQYLLKLRRNRKGEVLTGFLTKLTQKGAIPKAFIEWGNHWQPKDAPEMPIYLFAEDFRAGWKILDWRFGQSQNWATMVHPCGFTVEIYLQQLLELMKTITVVNGVLQGEFMWKDHTLIKKAS